MLEGIKILKAVAKELNYGLVEKSMQDNLSMIHKMVKECIYGLMVKFS